MTLSKAAVITLLLGVNATDPKPEVLDIASAWQNGNAGEDFYADNAINPDATGVHSLTKWGMSGEFQANLDGYHVITSINIKENYNAGQTVEVMDVMDQSYPCTLKEPTPPTSEALINLQSTLNCEDESKGKNGFNQLTNEELCEYSTPIYDVDFKADATEDVECTITGDLTRTTIGNKVSDPTFIVKKVEELTTSTQEDCSDAVATTPAVITYLDEEGDDITPDVNTPSAGVKDVNWGETMVTTQTKFPGGIDAVYECPEDTVGNQVVISSSEIKQVGFKSVEIMGNKEILVEHPEGIDELFNQAKEAMEEGDGDEKIEYIAELKRYTSATERATIVAELETQFTSNDLALLSLVEVDEDLINLTADDNLSETEFVAWVKAVNLLSSRHLTTQYLDTDEKAKAAFKVYDKLSPSVAGITKADLKNLVHIWGQFARHELILLQDQGAQRLQAAFKLIADKIFDAPEAVATAVATHQAAMLETTKKNGLTKNDEWNADFVTQFVAANLDGNDDLDLDEFNDLWDVLIDKFQTKYQTAKTIRVSLKFDDDERKVVYDGFNSLVGSDNDGISLDDFLQIKVQWDAYWKQAKEDRKWAIDGSPLWAFAVLGGAVVVTAFIYCIVFRSKRSVATWGVEEGGRRETKLSLL